MTIRRQLQMHESSRSSLSGVEVEVARSGARSLRLRWVARGTVRNIRLPKLHAIARADTKEVCRFSLFARAVGQDEHLRLDVFPSGKWELALFASRTGQRSEFTSGRVSQFDILERLKPLSDDKRAKLKQSGFDTLERFEPSFLSISATLELKPNYELPPETDWELGAAALIEEKNGNRSCWALAHPPGAPDLSHPDSFAIRLPTSAS